MPIVKSPSGHPCIVIDEYAKVIAPRAGGVKEAVPTLYAGGTTATSEPKRKLEISVMTADTYPLVPQHVSRNSKPKVLVVEEQPIASIFFADQGFTVEKRSHAEMIATESQQVNGEIKKSKYSAVWMTLPPNSSVVPKRKAAQCSKTLSLWFRSAALAGTLAFLFGQRGNSWTDSSIVALCEDGIATMSKHRLCHFGESYDPENKLPSAGSYSLLCTQPVNSQMCKCEANTPHCKDFEDIIGRPYGTQRRLKVQQNVTQHVFNHTKHLWMSRTPKEKKQVFYEDEVHEVYLT